MPFLHHEAYVARGSGGQVLAVIPSLDLVAVHQTDTLGGGGVDFEDATRVFNAIVSAYDGNGVAAADSAMVELSRSARVLCGASHRVAAAGPRPIRDRRPNG